MTRKLVKLKIFFFVSVFFWLRKLNEASITIQYEGLTNDYIRWKQKSTGNLLYLSESGRRWNLQDLVDSGNDQPIREHNKTKMKNICKSFVYNINYVYVESDSNSSNESLGSSIERKHYLMFNRIPAEFKLQTVNFDSTVYGSMKVFLCASDKDNDYYLTYAFQADHYITLSVPKDSEINGATNVKFYALVRPSAKVDPHLLKYPTYFVHSFWGHYMFGGFNFPTEESKFCTNIVNLADKHEAF